MSDPEILDPLQAQSTSDIEDLLAQVQRALPGRTVRVDISRPSEPQRFRLEAEGEGGAIVLQSGPFFTASVVFRSARFSFSLAPGSDSEVVFRQMAARVRQLADDELVVFEEPAPPPLLRTVVLQVVNGRLESVVDSGIAPGHADAPRLCSFRGTWARAPTRQERARIDQLTGGLVGALKRKVLAKILSKTAGSIMSAVEQAAAREGDDGSRKLKG